MEKYNEFLQGCGLVLIGMLIGATVLVCFYVAIQIYRTVKRVNHFGKAFDNLATAISKVDRNAQIEIEKNRMKTVSLITHLDDLRNEIIKLQPKPKAKR